MANPRSEPSSNIDAGSGTDAVMPLITIWLRANSSLPFELADVCGTKPTKSIPDQVKPIKAGKSVWNGFAVSGQAIEGNDL